MFHNAIEWAKTHPVIIAGIAGVFVLYYLLSSSGSSGSSATTGAGGPTDAEVNAAAAVNIAQLQANAHSQDTGAALQAQSNALGAQVTEAQISAQVANYQVEQSANVQVVGINAQKDVQIAGLTTQEVIALAADATDQARISAVEAIANAPYNLAAVQINALAGADPNSALAKVLKNAESTKNSYVNIGGISAGRNTPPSQWGAALSGASGIFGALASVI